MTEQSFDFDRALDTNSRASQARKILSAMEQGHKLTCLDILRDFGCMNAKGRIFELRRDGHPITDEWITTSGGARVKRYFISQ
jgi:hypothetical protein